MKIEIKVKPKAKKTEVQKQADGAYLVKVKEPPEKGKANQAVIDALSDFFGVPKQNVTILRGQASSRKLIEILN